METYDQVLKILEYNDTNLVWLQFKEDTMNDGTAWEDYLLQNQPPKTVIPSRIPPIDRPSSQGNRPHTYWLVKSIMETASHDSNWTKRTAKEKEKKCLSIQYGLHKSGQLDQETKQLKQETKRLKDEGKDEL